MRATVRRNAGWAVIAALLTSLAAFAGLQSGFYFNDYDFEASAAVARLLDGDVGGFLASAPAYGGSLIIRSPTVFAAALFDGGELAAYRALALPGLVGIALIAALLAGVASRRGWSRGACFLIVVLAVLNPAAGQALRMGHAEELLGASLCVGSMLLAVRGRWIAAAVVLGLAVGNKQWALVAVLPVLLALPAASRMRAGLLAAAVACLVMAPLLIQGSGVQTTAAVATSSGGFSKPLQVWWFAGPVMDLPPGTALPAGTRAPAEWVSLVSRPAIIFLAALLSAAWWRLRRPLDSGFGLLALVLLIRCLLDPWSLPYYHLPFILALLAWEAHTARRMPWATLAAAAVLKAILVTRPYVGSDALSLAYCAVAVPGAVALGIAVLAPERGRRLTGALRRAPAHARVPVPPVLAR